MAKTSVFPGMPTLTVGACLLALLCLGPLCRADQDPGLVAHYSFEEGPGEDTPVKDWSGSGNDGRNMGAKYVRVGDGDGFALRFGTADAVVDCGKKKGLDLTRALTIELWFYPETLPKKGEPGLVGKTMGSFMLSYAGGGCWFYVNTGSTRTDCSTPTSLKT